MDTNAHVCGGDLHDPDGDLLDPCGDLPHLEDLPHPEAEDLSSSKIWHPVSQDHHMKPLSHKRRDKALSQGKILKLTLSRSAGQRKRLQQISI